MYLFKNQNLFYSTLVNSSLIGKNKLLLIVFRQFSILFCIPHWHIVTLKLQYDVYLQKILDFEVKHLISLSFQYNYIKVEENKNEHSLDSFDFIVVVIILGLSHNGTIYIVHERCSLG